MQAEVQQQLKQRTEIDFELQDTLVLLSRHDQKNFENSKANKTWSACHDDLEAVKELPPAALMVCKKNIAVWNSDRIMELTISEMQCSKSQISKQLLDALYDRTKSRRNQVLVHLEYLYDSKFLEKKKDQVRSPTKKKSIYDYDGKLISKMYLVEGKESEVLREEILSDVMESQSKNRSFQERLDNYVE